MAERDNAHWQQCTRRIRRPTLFISVLLLLAGCGSREKPPISSQFSAAPSLPAAPQSRPEYRGDAIVNAGLHVDASVTHGGEYTIGLRDARGDELPASTVSNLTLEIERLDMPSRPVSLRIDATGDSWVGKGMPVPDAHTMALIALSFRGEHLSASMPLSMVDAQQDYVCPMHPDIRSKVPGVCPRCGMTLALGLPKPVAYPLELKIAPTKFHPGQKVRLTFAVKDPKTGRPVQRFEVMHERLFHLFILSADLQYFVHDHPEFQKDGSFRYDAVFPKAGMYRAVADFYPTGGTPQLISKPVSVLGPSGQSVPTAQASLSPDTGVQHGQNTDVELVLDPPQPRSGQETALLFRMKRDTGMERYLGAWAHILIASDDLVDLIHDHPAKADGDTQMLLRFAFPRARTYRLWIQFQRQGVVNTVAFNIPASESKVAHR